MVVFMFKKPYLLLVLSLVISSSIISFCDKETVADFVEEFVNSQIDQFETAAQLPAQDDQAELDKLGTESISQENEQFIHAIAGKMSPQMPPARDFRTY